MAVSCDSTSGPILEEMDSDLASRIIELVGIKSPLQWWPSGVSSADAAARYMKLYRVEQGCRSSTSAWLPEAGSTSWKLILSHPTGFPKVEIPTIEMKAGGEEE